MLPDDEDEELNFESVQTLHQAMGEAISAYAEVETTMASLLQNILKIDVLKAHTIFFAVQNVRSRNELLQALLSMQFKGSIKKYWASCSKFLLVLAQFRNAVAHWHPHTNVYTTNDLTPLKFVPALGHPAIESAFKSIEVSDFPAFLKDCLHIREELSALVMLVKEMPEALPEKFQKPITHRNQAVLQPPPKPKAPQPRRPPSVPKLSKAQKRAKAKKAARLRAQASNRT